MVAAELSASRDRPVSGKQIERMQKEAWNLFANVEWIFAEVAGSAWLIMTPRAVNAGRIPG